MSLCHFDHPVYNVKYNYVTILFSLLSDVQGNLDSASAELKEERLESKRLKSELVRTQDELAETKAEKDSTETVK